jgi:acyl transferase domain-containing protein/NAD(P)-dependent dehydrogenase (short-subunit alcohol dehydrogenase family)/acyl carrier protein
MQEKSSRNGLEIAITGMSGRFPGAGNIHEFWENLKNGVNSIRFFSEEELLENSNLDPDDIKQPNYIKARGIITNVEYFDASFFGYSPAEAELLDPQIRVFYEICWEALEDAGCDPSAYNGSIGVYAGGSPNRNWEVLTITSGKQEIFGQFASDNMSDKDYISSRISHKLDLNGPAVSMYTACSTALVGLDLACRGLLTGQCDAALVGGVSALVETARGGGYFYEEGLIRSPDGYVYAFDARAGGVVFSHGGGVVLLKRLDDAVADGDSIYAVIKGFAVNNDGLNKSSFTAPAVDGQAECIRTALFMSGLDPETVTYVETHGTGTVIGDPIEIEALKLAFAVDKRKYCAIGSLKTNIGHLDVAAGAAAVIKVALMMKHRQIPPSLNYETPNPKIDFENSPFYVNTRLREWKSNGYPLRAGVSSFGVGGTNAHVVMEEPPEPEPSAGGRPYQLLLLSARTANALEQATRNMSSYLKENPGVNLADVAYSLKPGRKTFEHRRMLVCSHVQEAVDILESVEHADHESPVDSQRVQAYYGKEEKRVVFMFPGQGSQYVNMARGIYETEAVFRDVMDQCFDILKPLMGYDIKEILYPGSAPQRTQSAQRKEFYNKTSASSAASAVKIKLPDIDQTEIAQPVLFAVEYALAKLLISWGIAPYAMIGHSIGEYAAACLSGVFSLEDALTLVVQRGKLMQQMPPGSMLGVSLAEHQLQALLTKELDLAAVNGPSQCAVSGPYEAIDAFARQLENNGHPCRKLHTSHAYHSKMMEPILKPFEEKAARVKFGTPAIPFISDVTGGWITFEDAADPGYWSGHLRRTVRFGDGLAELLKEKNSILIEVGPGRTLSTFVRRHPHKQPEHMLVNLVRHPGEEAADECYLLTRLGQVWLYGKEVDWREFYSGERRYRLHLPAYPFQRQRYWIEGNPVTMIKEGLNRRILPGKKADMADWFYTPSWKRSVIYPGREEQGGKEAPRRWLVFTGDKNDGFTARLVKRLTEEPGVHVTMVRQGDVFAEQEKGSYSINPGRLEDYEALIKALHDSNGIPHRVVHLWNLSAGNDDCGGLETEQVEKSLEPGFYSLVYLAAALGAYDVRDIHIMVLTDGMQEVWGEKISCPEKAVVLGPVLVIPLEYPGIKCRSIDIDMMNPGSGDHGEGKYGTQWLMDRLLKEFRTGITGSDVVIAYRGNYRLVRCFESTPFNRPDTPAPRLREGGVYLITGGLGGIGLVVAGYLAKVFRSKLILTGRSAFPAAEEWDRWLDTHSSLDSTSRKIRKIRELEALGAEVRIYNVDTAHEQGMGALVEEVKKQWGSIHGVIHAAGVPGGGMIQLKTREMADRVLSPKVKGTLVLHRVLRRAGIHPDFMVLCSSVNSVVPAVGQVDYFSANAFLDAFAFYNNAVNGHGTFTVSINWDAWQEVGMAVEAARQWAGDKYNQAPGPFEPRPLDHPLLDHYRYVTTAAGPPGGAKQQIVYTTYFSTRRHWVADQHRSREGKGIVPGVTYLEMAHAAMQNHLNNNKGQVKENQNQDRIIEIRDVSFFTPLMLDGGEEREALMILKQKDASDSTCFEFSVRSRIRPGENKWERHAGGEVALAVEPAESPGRPEVHDLKEIEKRCSLEAIDVASNWRGDAENSLLRFGPRWGSLKTVKIGNKEGLALLELADEFQPEVGRFTLYPSILDFGTAFLSDRMNKQTPYIPYAYKRLRVSGPFPARVYSHCRWREDGGSGDDFLKFDLIFMDELGRELVEIESFTMLAISKEMLGRLKDKEQGREVMTVAGTGGLEVEDEVREKETVSVGPVREGILPLEGIEALMRVLSEDQPQVAVSTIDLAARLEAVSVPDIPETAGRLYQAHSSGTAHSRPDISSPYVAPFTEAEQKMAGIWQELLGIDRVGAVDDFFELGGDSLKASAMISKIKKEFNAHLSISDIFSAPRVKDLSRILEGFGLPDAGYIDAAVEPAEKKEYYMLSQMQKRMYILNELEGVGTAYNLPVTYIVEGKPDRRRLQRTFQWLVNRHESLRTSYRMMGPEPVQIIHDNAGLCLEYWEAGEDEIKSIISTFIRPFDLMHVPLLRAGLVKISPEKYILLFDIHHIAADGTSIMIIILREFVALYDGKDLPGSRFQYKDFSEWQNRETGKTYLEKQEEFWLKRFKSDQNMAAPGIYTDFPRPGVQSFAGETISFLFDNTFTGKVNGLVKETGTTLYMVLLAALTIVLSKFSGHEDIVVGTSVAGRERPEFQDIVGLFINALPMRNDAGADKTFSGFLTEVKENTLEAFENQGYPFGELIKELGLLRDIGRHPLYDAELIVQNMEMPEFELEGLRFSRYEYDVKTTPLDIVLEAIEVKGGIFFDLSYCTKLFKRETMKKFIEFFKQVLNTVIENHEVKLGDMNMPHELGKAAADVVQGEDIQFGF